MEVTIKGPDGPDRPDYCLGMFISLASCGAYALACLDHLEEVVAILDMWSPRLFHQHIGVMAEKCR
jgi:hypothetical protein